MKDGPWAARCCCSRWRQLGIKLNSMSLKSKCSLAVCISHVPKWSAAEKCLLIPLIGCRHWLVGHLVLVWFRTLIHVLRCAETTHWASLPCPKAPQQPWNHTFDAVVFKQRCCRQENKKKEVRETDRWDRWRENKCQRLWQLQELPWCFTTINFFTVLNTDTFCMH